MSTMIDERTDTFTVNTDTGDHDRFAHYFRKEDLDLAFFEGKTIKALCGKEECPTRDFTKFPVCPACKSIFENLPPGEDA